jgi:hypothetical protein
MELACVLGCFIYIALNISMSKVRGGESHRMLHEAEGTTQFALSARVSEERSKCTVWQYWRNFRIVA